MQLKRKLYTRGSSYETTIPKPLLFALDLEKKHEVNFHYDAIKGRWYIDFSEQEVKTKGTGENVRRREGRNSGGGVR